MRFGLVVLLCSIMLTMCVGASGQGWNSGTTSGYLTVERSQLGPEHTFTFKNPVVSDKDYTVLGWTLQPFNIAVPVSVVSPEGWEWVETGGWKQFRVADADARYDAGGPALEPGESLTFIYTVGQDATPVNPGGPDGPGVAFLSHVAAVEGQADGRWIETTREGNSTWYDAPTTTYDAPATPEPSSRAVIISALCALACLVRKRARV